MLECTQLVFSVGSSSLEGGRKRVVSYHLSRRQVRPLLPALMPQSSSRLGGALEPSALRGADPTPVLPRSFTPSPQNMADASLLPRRIVKETQRLLSEPGASGKSPPLSHGGMPVV